MTEQDLTNEVRQFLTAYNEAFETFDAPRITLSITYRASQYEVTVPFIAFRPVRTSRRSFAESQRRTQALATEVVLSMTSKSYPSVVVPLLPH